MITDLTIGTPYKVLIKFCIPLLASVIFQQFYNIADTFIAGKYIGEASLAAVGNSYEITLIFLSIAFGANMGSGIQTAESFGAKKYGETKTTIYTALIFWFIAAFALTIICFILSGAMLRLINTPDSIFVESLDYLRIYILGLIFIIVYNAVTGIFSAIGDSKTPFAFLAISSLSNVALDIAFVKVFGMGVRGLAIATLLCQIVMCIAAFFILMIRIKEINVGDEKVDLFSTFSLKRILLVGLPSMLQQGSVSVGNVIIQGIVNGFGPQVIAGFTAAMKYSNVVNYSLGAIGGGVSSYIAQNHGAKKPERIHEGYKAACVMTVAIFVPLGIIYNIFAPNLIRFLISNPTDVALMTGVNFFKIVTPFYVLLCIKVMTDATLRGLRRMKPYIIITMIDLFCRVFFLYVFSIKFGQDVMWASWPIGWVVGFVLIEIYYQKLKKEKVV